MGKRIQTVVPETQQQITTTVERAEGELKVNIRACSPLDDELRSEFHAEIDTFGPETVSVRSSTEHSNQGNETGQEVTVRFPVEDKLQAIDVIDEVVQIGKTFYDRQLERDLAREETEGDSTWKHTTQQKYFDDEAVKEFSLLYRGRVDF